MNLSTIAGLILLTSSVDTGGQPLPGPGVKLLYTPGLKALMLEPQCSRSQTGYWRLVENDRARYLLIQKPCIGV